MQRKKANGIIMHFIQKLPQIRLFVTDADGVLTDGQIYYSDKGEEIKVFNVQDGEGLKQIKQHGIRTAIISGRSSESLRRRAQELAIDDVYMGVNDKPAVLKKILDANTISAEETLYIGDDVGDLGALLSVGFRVAVANAHDQVKRCADYVTAKPGGAGAVREICDLIISEKETPSERTEMKGKIVRVRDIKIGGGLPLVLFAGPCVIESRDHALQMAEAIKKISEQIGVSFVFKSSYDKANRSSIDSYRGPRCENGLRILEEVQREVGVPVLSDVHCVDEVDPAASILDVLQIPAFLCRQTDLLVSVGQSGKPVKVKKGQFMAPWDMTNVIKKIASTGNEQILLTERGSSFGYNNLVVDMTSLPVMKETGYPVVFDATHSVQQPGSLGKNSGGRREFVGYLARAAAGVGIDALFMEVHNRPDEALCDGPNMVNLEQLELILRTVAQIDRVVKNIV